MAEFVVEKENSTVLVYSEDKKTYCTNKDLLSCKKYYIDKISLYLDGQSTCQSNIRHKLLYANPKFVGFEWRMNSSQSDKMSEGFK
jgi:hypothetical protein